MKKTLKFLCLVTAIILTVSVFSSCGRQKGDPPVWTDDDRVVLTVGDYNVTYDFYRYLFLNTKATYPDSDLEAVRKYVENSLANTYGMFALADKFELTLTDAEKEYVEGYMDSSREGLTDEEYKNSLEQSYMTEDVYRFALEVQQLEYLVYDYVINERNGVLRFSDDDLLKAIDTDFVRASHILFTFKNDEEKATQMQKAQSVLERLKNGEDFEALKEEFSADTDLKNNKDGYYFTHGEFENEFEYTAFELDVGELSDIITTDVGIHIVKRLPIEEAYVKEHLEELRSSFKTALYYEMVEAESEKFEYNYKDKYKNITLDFFN